MTKHELAEQAKALGIKGIWNMNVSQLEAAIAAHGGETVSDETESTDEVPAETEVSESTEVSTEVLETPAETESTDEVSEETAEETEKKVSESAAKAAAAKALVEAKRHSEMRKITKFPLETSPRDKETAKVLRKGHNLSGNVPFAPKPYFLGKNIADENDVNFLAAPKQVKAIFRTMKELDITSSMTALRGKEIVDLAKSNGFLTSVIDSAVLFAYYRRALEVLGLEVKTDMEDDDAFE